MAFICSTDEETVPTRADTSSPAVEAAVAWAAVSSAEAPIRSIDPNRSVADEVRADEECSNRSTMLSRE